MESRGTADQERRIDAQSAGISGRDVVVRGQVAADIESRGNLNSADLASGDVAVRNEVAFNANRRAGETADIRSRSIATDGQVAADIGGAGDVTAAVGSRSLISDQTNVAFGLELTGVESAVISASDVPFKSRVANEVHDGINAQRAETAARSILIGDEVAADFEGTSAQRADGAFRSLVAGERRVAGNRQSAADIRAAVRAIGGVADNFEIAADSRALRKERAVIAACDVAVESRITADVHGRINAQCAVAAARGILIGDEVAADLERGSAQRAVGTCDRLVAGERRVAGNRRRADDIRAAVRSIGGVVDNFKIAADSRALRVERADICACGVLREGDVLLDDKGLADIRGAVATARGIPLKSRGTADLESREDAQSAGMGGRGVVVRGQIAADGEALRVNRARVPSRGILRRIEGARDFDCVTRRVNRAASRSAVANEGAFALADRHVALGVDRTAFRRRDVVRRLDGSQDCDAGRFDRAALAFGRRIVVGYQRTVDNDLARADARAACRDVAAQDEIAVFSVFVRADHDRTRRLNTVSSIVRDVRARADRNRTVSEDAADERARVPNEGRFAADIDVAVSVQGAVIAHCDIILEDRRSGDVDRACGVETRKRTVRRIVLEGSVAVDIDVAARVDRAVVVLDLGRVTLVIARGVVHGDQIALNGEALLGVESARDFGDVADEGNGESRVGFGIHLEDDFFARIDRAAGDILGRVAGRFGLVVRERRGDDRRWDEGIDRAGAFRRVSFKGGVRDIERARGSGNSAAGERFVRVEARALDDEVAARVDRAAEFRRAGRHELIGIGNQAVVVEGTVFDHEDAVVEDGAAKTGFEVVAVGGGLLPERFVRIEIDVLQGQVAGVVDRAADVRASLLEGQVGDGDRRVVLDVHDTGRAVAADGHVAIFAENSDVASDDVVFASVDAFAEIDSSFDDDGTLRRIESDRRALEGVGEGNVGTDGTSQLRDAVSHFEDRTVGEGDRLFNASVTGRKRTDGKLFEGEV